MVDLDLFYRTVKFCLGAFVWEKANSGIFWKVDICNQLNDFFINTKGHVLTFVLDASDSVFLSFPLKLSFGMKAGLTETKLHVESLLHRGMKVCSWDLGHMIKMAAMRIYGKKKPFENVLLRNRMADDFET